MKREIKKYINQILGSNTLDGNFISIISLPFYLLELYDIYTASLLNNKCIFMVVKGENQTATNVSKHIKTIAKHHDIDVIYVTKSLQSYQRKRLIEKDVPFIVPSNQMYIPMLGLDLREHFKQVNNPDKALLSPLAQVLTLQFMNEIHTNPLTSKYLVNTTNYSPMTVNRAFNQLAGYKLAELVKVKREKQLNFIEDKAVLWKKSLKYLKSPIRKTIFLYNRCDGDHMYRAGEMALSDQTMLSPPIWNQLAIGYQQWQDVKGDYIEDIENKEGDIELEIWNYDPGLVSTNNRVDKYSLYLRLKENKDERIQMALEELIK